MIRYAPEQQRIINAIIRRGRQRGESKVKIKANLETGSVESNYRNLQGGGGDSAGYRQERKSLYPDPTNLTAAIDRFYNEADKLYKSGMSSGTLAADVQRPAAQYRGRYAQASRQAEALLRSAGDGDASTPQIQTHAGASRDQLQAILSQSLQRGYAPSGTELANAIIGDATAPQQQATTLPRQAATTTSAKGIGKFEGVPVAAWIVPELKYARAHGWKGKVISGYRSYADQKRIYDSGVRPAAKPGQSNHEMTGYPGGAVDVTDPQTLSRILQRKGSKLRWAGAKDNVHFSVPRNGTY